MTFYENYRKLAESSNEGFDLVKVTLGDEFVDFIKYCLLHTRCDSERLHYRKYDLTVECFGLSVNYYSGIVQDVNYVMVSYKRSENERYVGRMQYTESNYPIENLDDFITNFIKEYVAD